MANSRPQDPTVVVVGSVHMDLIANAPRLPSPGESVLGTRFTMYPGGKGGNQAIAAAQQSASTTIVARVGDDEFGETLRSSLSKKQVDVSLLQVDGIEATGVSPVLMNEEGEYASIIVPGASSSLTPALLEPCSSALESAAVLMLQLEIELAASAAAAQFAHSTGGTVILNASPAAALEGTSAWKIWRDVDVLIVNRHEAGILLNVSLGDGEHGIRVASGLKSLLGVTGVVITLGAAGAVLADASGAIHLPGYEVPVVDTIGAGDAFAGAVGAGLARGLTLRDAACLGNAAGALAVGQRGAYDASPTLEQTERFMAANH